MTRTFWTRLALVLPLAAQTFCAASLQAQELKPMPAGDAAPMMIIDRATFVPVVAGANAFEVQSSTLARDHALNKDIKVVAEMIIADHTKAGEKLKVTLEGKGVPLPETQLAPKHRKMIEQLQAAKGNDFDTLYLDMQAEAHMEAVALFRTYAGSGDDQALVGFAKETLPNLETHLAHVKMLIEEK